MKCLVNDKVLHEYLFAAGTLSLFNISMHTRQYTDRTAGPVMLSDITSYQGAQPEEQNNRRKRNEAERAIKALLVMANPRTQGVIASPDGGCQAKREKATGKQVL